MNILIGICVVLLLLVVVIALRPNRFRVQRSTVVAAPTQRVYALVNDFHSWSSWSPWEKMDPQLQRKYSGSESGAGAVYSWTGNQKVGEGTMTIQLAEPPNKIGILLEFYRPMRATNGCEFTFVPEGTGTRVTWAMEGRNSFSNKAMQLVMSMDRLIGKDFERGLASLKEQAESR